MDRKTKQRRKPIGNEKKMEQIYIKCRRCGEKIEDGMAVCVKRQAPKRIVAETYKTSYQTTKWVTEEQDGRMMLCRECDKRLKEWLRGHETDKR